MDPAQPVLAGIRIVDMTSVIFGPYATMMLADLGADVIKVEPPTGDAFRAAGAPVHTPGMGACTMTLNRGKRSIALDLKDDDDCAVMRDLLATADVFIHNVRADAIARLGFDYASVQEVKPDIVYVHCVGFGSGGPYAELQAYDDLIQGLTACTDLLRHADGNPKQRYLPMAIADKVSGLYGAQAVQSGIIHKLRTGHGQFIEVPMFEAMTHFTYEEHLFGATFVPANGPILYQRQVSPTRQPYPTADGHLCIVLYTDDKLVMFLNLVGRGDVLADPRFADRAGRMANMTALYVIIGEIIATRSTATWVQLCADVDIPAMPTHTTETVLADPHLVATGFFKLREHPSEGPYLEMQPPVRYGGAAQADLRPAPRIGEHSAEIRAEIRAELAART
jgi:crotonobetainyl-CoA:carnitine CoA-transferase CaiB-like acyl-CoA transferase